MLKNKIPDKAIDENFDQLVQMIANLESRIQSGNPTTRGDNGHKYELTVSSGLVVAKDLGG